MTMRRATAETIRDGQGWYWPSNSRTAHYYLKDHRTACGRGLVLVLPDELDGFTSPPSRSDCAGCRRKVDDAHAALTPAHTMQPPSDTDLRWTCSACDWTASPSFTTSEERTERFARHHQSTKPDPGR